MSSAASTAPGVQQQSQQQAHGLDDSTVPTPPTQGGFPVPPGYTCITEGGARVLFKTGEVFYNPVQILNRDLSTLALRVWDARRCASASPKERARAYVARGMSGVEAAAAVAAAPTSMPPLRIMEALSASGLRSLRYAAELPPGRVGLIVANDLEPTAAEAIRRNAAFNGHTMGGKESIVVPNSGDATLVMHLAARGLPLLPSMPAWMPLPPPPTSPAASSSSSSGGGEGGNEKPNHPRPFLFDNVDLDPYGSASPFLDAAMECIGEGGLLAITCTDMAVLAGNHVDSCRVKYGGLPVKGRHFGEQALRLLLACVETTAARHKKAITPLASLCVDFYVRVFVTVNSSANRAATAPLRLANLHQCSGCDAFWVWPLGRDKKGGESKGIQYPAKPGKEGEGEGEGEGERVVEAACAAAAAAAASGGGGGGGGGRKRARVEEGGKEEGEKVVEGVEGVAAAPAPAPAAAAVAPPPKVGVSRPSPPPPRQIVTTPNTAPDLPCNCPHCGRSVVVGGPIWIDPIHDTAFLKDLERAAMESFGEDGKGGVTSSSSTGSGSGSGGSGSSGSSAPTPTPSPSLYDLVALSQPRGENDGGSNGSATVAASRRRLLGVLHSLAEELPNVPLYYEVASLFSKVKGSPVTLNDFRAGLENSGYATSGSHAAPGVVKTNAPPSVVWAVVRACLIKEGKISGGGGGGAGVVEGSGSGNGSGSGSGSGGVTSRPPPRHASFVPPSTAALTPLPMHLALTSLHSLQPTEFELEGGVEGISFLWSQGMERSVAARREEKSKGGGQRFCSNPQPGWGPKARATGEKK